MQTELYEVINMGDQLPRIGCGTRIVRARVGRKWVRVTDNHPNPESRSRQRCHIRTWNSIKKRFLADLGDVKL